jgi:transcriptional regulator with XRE-family HTH domain
MRVTVSAFRPITPAPTYIYSARVIPLSTGDNSFTAEHEQLSRTQYKATPGAAESGRWSYRHPVPDSSDHGRKIAFAAFVRKALNDARATRAWTGTEVSRRTGVSRQTINRWVRGEWASDPEAERVVAFCEGLGINPTVAFGVLGWDRNTPARPTPGAPPMDPDVEALLRRLVDPNVSDVEKFHIRETIRYLAYKPTLPANVRKDGKRAG